MSNKCNKLEAYAGQTPCPYTYKSCKNQTWPGFIRKINCNPVRAYNISPCHFQAYMKPNVNIAAASHHVSGLVLTSKILKSEAKIMFQLTRDEKSWVVANCNRFKSEQDIYG